MKSHLATIAAIILMLTLAGSMPAAPQDAPASTAPASTETAAGPEALVNVILDELHNAAAAADVGRYFSLFSPQAVFLGTDPHERWTYDKFWDYAKERFDTGKGWKYDSRIRNVSFNSNVDTAWFDEVLYSEKYGVCRGTGVLTKSGAAWSIVQYSLSIPLPNEMAEDVVRMIEQRGSTDRDLTRVILIRHAEEDAGKQGGTQGLSVSGKRRSRKLAAVLKSEVVHVVFSTESAPAVLTIGPITRENGMKPQVFSSSNTEFLATSLRNDYPGRTIIVCGAAPSIKDMLKYFGVDDGIEIGPRDYDDLFIVTIDNNRMAHLQHLHY